MKYSRMLYRLMIFILAAAMLLSGLFFLRDIGDSLCQKQHYDALAARVDAQREASAATLPASAPVEPAIAPEYALLYEENPDLVGWLFIEGTPIDYPVMQTPHQPDYYLYRNFEKEESAHGCLYVCESCDVFAPSDNVTIYGHHMKDGSMFTGLKKFRDLKFWEQYQTIVFDTLYEYHSYTIFAVFTTTASEGEGFPYHRFAYAADEEAFNEFVSTCKSLALYDTGITPRYGDKLICLSTCEYSQPNGRLVVAAVRNEENRREISRRFFYTSSMI